MVFRWQRGQAPCLELADFEIQPGERLFVHGPSGSGKSTLLGLLGGVLRPERGRIILQVEGRAVELGGLSDRERDRLRVDHIGFVFQQFNLVPYLSVLDNVCLPCRFSARRRQRLAGDERAEARRLLRALDLGPALEATPVTRLSVGQQQRVAVARALIGRPELLIADEPTSALDAQRQAGFLELLLQESAASGASVVFVSHDERLAAHFDRRVALAELNRAAALAELNRAAALAET
ncbi:ATP-binding cassette domain-containing protein [Ideonella sp. NS12-5]|uniref:ATP-binding cassette domain-containing protein n=1 Tax=Ideonella oryzae TaxID=2937441 RepID=A0ABT1BP58_9BURK|nr:ATP-binding cassette domain-containing protein [Ideonella oryzae]MCO5977933.1 ATP-binding cassette domain-containing protein [Ideonella oryzae]